MGFSCIYIQLAVSSSLKSSVVLIYRLCRENDGQKVENGILSAALCAESVTVIMAENTWTKITGYIVHKK